MSRLVDYEAVILDLRGRLTQRDAWGAGQLRALIDELERDHRIDESADRAVLRRFGDHIADTVLGVLPASATADPLTDDDPSRASAAMDNGAAIRSTPQTEEPCHHNQRHPPSPTTPGSSRAEARSQSRATVAAC